MEPFGLPNDSLQNCGTKAVDTLGCDWSLIHERDELTFATLRFLRRLDDCFYLLLLFNGIADPVIYALRMRNVRRAFFKINKISNG